LNPRERGACPGRQAEPNIKSGAGGRTRTDDLRFTKLLLTAGRLGEEPAGW